MGTKLIAGKNDLETVNPSLAKEWHKLNNGDLLSNMVTAGSSKKVWWKGICGHEWQATIASRNAGAGCPVCARKNNANNLRLRSIAKSGSLAIANTGLAGEWNTLKNGSLKPEDISPNSHEVVWWVCNKGHEWQASIISRNTGHGCPFCSGRKVLSGFNDLTTVNPALAKEWDSEKNLPLQSDQVSIGSNKKVWWKCSEGHEWQATIKSRSRGTGCPYCSSRILEKGKNTLAVLFPQISKEWNYEKNGELTPDDVMPGSHTKVWWKCSRGHEWQASPNHRTSKTRNCPYCSHNPMVNAGDNDLETCYPELAKEWNYEKNGNLMPRDVTSKSSKKVWWRCEKGHEWKTAVNHRANGSGCPICSTGKQTSFPEQAIFYYIHLVYPDAKNGYTDPFNNHGMELDIYVPSLKVGIEYDGAAFHKTKSHYDRELRKYNTCKEHDIFLIRIRENREFTSMDSCDALLNVNQSLDDVIRQLQVYIPKLVNIDIDTDHDREIIQSNYLSALKEGSLASIDPDLAKEWNYDKNMLGPEMYLIGSNEKVWWKCEKGHEWRTSIYLRHSRGTNCPYCSNNKVLPGFNDLKTLRQDLMKEWHLIKNINLDPEKIRPGSGKKVWWICEQGHEWQAEISSRNKGHGCPYCAGNKKIK